MLGLDLNSALMGLEHFESNGFSREGSEMEVTRQSSNGCLTRNSWKWISPEPIKIPDRIKNPPFSFYHSSIELLNY